MKQLIKALLPDQVLRVFRAVRRRSMRRQNERQSLREVFTRVYASNHWGGPRGQYCSGDGSSVAQARRYAEVVRELVAERHIRSVVDLGCGDFVVGRELQAPGVKYVGVDVVDGLVARNNREFGSRDVSFRCLDITRDELPVADLCLVRQVLQHLSNDEIAAVLKKIRRYRYALVTEHYPAPSVMVVPNKDKPHGGDTRILDGSAVYVDRPPFCASVSRLMLEVDAGANLVAPGESIRTYLLESETAASG